VECAFSEDRREPDDLSATDARNKCTVMIYKCTVLYSVPIMRKRKPASSGRRSALSAALWWQFQHDMRCALAAVAKTEGHFRLAAGQAPPAGPRRRR
jgi:hypothetical protein